MVTPCAMACVAMFVLAARVQGDGRVAVPGDVGDAHDPALVFLDASDERELRHGSAEGVRRHPSGGVDVAVSGFVRPRDAGGDGKQER
jgi:hypothetical protein